jgi:hypothetical protein
LTAEGGSGLRKTGARAQGQHRGQPSQDHHVLDVHVLLHVFLHLSFWFLSRTVVALFRNGTGKRWSQEQTFDQAVERMKALRYQRHRAPTLAGKPLPFRLEIHELAKM